jgi:hypothetical protein
LDAVACRQGCFLHALAIVESSVGAAEIFNAKGIPIADQPTVLTRDVAKRDPKIAVLATANDSDIAGDGETPPFAIRSKHHKYRLHKDMPSETSGSASPGIPHRIQTNVS